METAVALLAVAAVVIIVTAVSVRLPLPAPLVLMLVGIAISFVPFVPDLQLDPEVVLLGLLPPLLYATAIKTSAIDFRAQIASIGYLSIGLVLVTAVLIGLLTWAILPVSFAAAFALGAVVAPPDAVAATAVAKRIGLPRRLVGILEGESLVNDATAITCLRMGILALGGTVSVWQVTQTFLLALVGGIVIGVVAALVISRFRRHITETVLDTAVSFVAPFVAYLPGEAIGSSGVISVVTTGLILGHRAPVIQTAPSRLSERTNWSTIQFLLENTVFFLIGLLAKPIISNAAGTSQTGEAELSPVLVIGFCFAALVGVIVIRLVWTVVGMRLLLFKERGGRKSVRSALVGGWAGMRGVVTLAAALLLPKTTPHRDLLILAAMVVTSGTLLLNGLTLGPLARKLGVRGPDAREDALAMAAVMEEAGVKALARLEEDRPEQHSDPAMTMVRERVASRTNAIWERLGRGQDSASAPSEEYRRLRLMSLQYEREEVLRVRGSGTVDQEILKRVLGALDVEETMLAGIESSLEPIEGDPLTAPQSDLCRHLEDAPATVTPRGRECLDCIREDTSPVHLRICLTCGNVGCCDSSVGLHATRHYQETAHPVMRSFEPGEHWRWCYDDRRLG
ncbi:MAG: cation:proton antiporter [Propionibacteriaceae bacterium]